MTVAVAVRKGSRTIVAADTLVHFGGQRHDPRNARFHKIQPAGDSLIAWAGWALYAEMLDAHLAEHTAPPLRTETEVYAFFVDFWRSMLQDYSLQRQAARRDGRTPFVELDSVFIVANDSGIFRIAADMDVTRFEQYAAIGSGSEYALGALRVLYDDLDDPEVIAIRAVEVGIACDIYCDGPIDVVEVGARGRRPGSR